jgi:hypothetical protein
VLANDGCSLMVYQTINKFTHKFCQPKIKLEICRVFLFVCIFRFIDLNSHFCFPFFLAHVVSSLAYPNLLETKRLWLLLLLYGQLFHISSFFTWGSWADDI